MVAKSACRLIGEYAVWFGSGGPAANQLLGGALRILLSSLNLTQGVHGGAKHAANAFRVLCIRCANNLAGDPGSLVALMDAAAALYAPPPLASSLAESVPLDGEERTAVVEGLARVVAHLPPAHMGEAGIKLVQPLITRAASLAQSGEDVTLAIIHHVGINLALHISFPGLRIIY